MHQNLGYHFADKKIFEEGPRPLHHTTVTTPPRRIRQIFLYRALVRVESVNAYKCAKFQLPSSVSYGYEGGPKNK